MSSEKAVRMESSDQNKTSTMKAGNSDDAQGNTGKSGSGLRMSSEPPAGKQKRTHSDVAEASMEELTFIHEQLEVLSTDLKGTRESLKNLLNKDDIQSLIATTVKSIMEDMEVKFAEMIDMKVNEKTVDLQNRLDFTVYENGEIKDRLDKVEKELKDCQEQILDERSIVQAAMQKSNYNEQFSRKNNVKVMGIQVLGEESEQELTERVITLIWAKTQVNIDPAEIVAIHRIPSKYDPPPVLMKLKNNSVKTRLMKQRKIMKETGYKLVDDVTKLNTGLISRLMLHTNIDSAWFFNGAIYGKTTKGKRHKFDLYCNIDEVISDKKDKK